ncbi:hypothetical protein Mapa_015879 [Marchantia paleacea]|nr:hypothetical protein Mapa_015879 [Marchantia paleacea]
MLPSAAAAAAAESMGSPASASSPPYLSLPPSLSLGLHLKLHFPICSPSPILSPPPPPLPLPASATPFGLQSEELIPHQPSLDSPTSTHSNPRTHENETQNSLPPSLQSLPRSVCQVKLLPPSSSPLSSVPDVCCLLSTSRSPFLSSFYSHAKFPAACRRLSSLRSPPLPSLSLRVYPPAAARVRSTTTPPHTFTTSSCPQRLPGSSSLATLAGFHRRAWF